MSTKTEKTIDMVNEDRWRDKVFTNILFLRFQVHSRDLWDLFLDYFIQTKSYICPTFANNCDGNLFPENRKEKNIVFVQ